MIVIKYTNPKRYKTPQWFVTTLKKYQGESYRHFIDDNIDYFGLVGWYDMPTIRELKKYGTIESMPDSLKSHILEVIFTYSKDSSGFIAIKNLLSVKG